MIITNFIFEKEPKPKTPLIFSVDTKKPQSHSDNFLTKLLSSSLFLLDFSSHTSCRSSEASSLSLEFSFNTLSWVSDTRFSLSIRQLFSLRSLITWDQSSSRCLCFLILDLLADSLFESILLCFLSSTMMMLWWWWCWWSSSEVELLPIMRSWRMDDDE